MTKAQFDISTEKVRTFGGLSCIICRTTYKCVEYKQAYAYCGLREARSKFRAYVLAEDAKCIWNEPVTV